MALEVVQFRIEWRKTISLLRYLTHAITIDNNIEVYCSLGWEECANKLSPTSSNNLTYHFSLIKTF